MGCPPSAGWSTPLAWTWDVVTPPRSLLPASEGWGKVLFSVCLSVHISGGTQVRSRGVPHPRSGQGGYPIPGLAGGIPGVSPWPGLDGVPPRPGMGYLPGPGMGYPPDLGQGTPQTWDRVPPQTWDGVPLHLGWGTPPDLGRGTPPGPGMGYPPRPGTGYHPPDLGWGTPQPWMGYPPSIASTCFAGGGMPLAFTQEDFFVTT